MMCVALLLGAVNFWEQKGQAKGFSPVWCTTSNVRIKSDTFNQGSIRKLPPPPRPPRRRNGSKGWKMYEKLNEKIVKEKAKKGKYKGDTVFKYRTVHKLDWCIALMGIILLLERERRIIRISERKKISKETVFYGVGS